MEICRGKEIIVLSNKIDLDRNLVDAEEVRRALGDVPLVGISAETGEGLERLETAIVDKFRLGQVQAGRGALITNVRHQAALRRGADHLRGALGAVGSDLPLDLVSIDLRGAWEALGEVTGETASEDLLDEIFSRFCIGK
jgi:tRNA modification GTPase